MIFPALILALTAATATPKSRPPHPVPQPPPIVYAHHAIATSDPTSQALFDRGLTLFYAYNGSEGVHIFEQLAQREPSFAMAYWGQALSYSQDINTDLTQSRFALAHTAIERAVALLTPATAPQDRALIEAMRVRYAGPWDKHDRAETNYRQAMASAAAAYANDDDLLALYCEALLEHAGTRLWDGSTPLSAETTTMADLLDRIIARNPQHIMANHLLIHLYEPATDHSRAVAAARRLDAMRFANEDEHLAHMPAHTYIDTGQYAQAVTASKRAITLFDAYLLTPEIDATHTHYMGHDLRVGYAAAMMLGDYESATWFAQRLKTRDAEYVFLTDLRFGFPEKSVAQADPGEAAFFTHLHQNDFVNAKKDLKTWFTVQKDADRPAYEFALRAELAMLSGDTSAAKRDFKRARETEAEDNTGESIPLFPTGEIEAAAAIRHGDYASAEAPLRDTLQKYPNNPRALLALSQVLEQLGQHVEAQATYMQFSHLWPAKMPLPTLAGI